MPPRFGLTALIGLVVSALAACHVAPPAAPPGASLEPTPTVRAGSQPAPAPTRIPHAPETAYAGWAAFAYPGDTLADLVAMLERHQAAGANIIWMGHNNPGEVFPDKKEPALSYAVYQAAQDPTHPEHATAHAIIESQHRFLQAARQVGLPAVFPIGYQIHMGAAWNSAHPQDLRHDAAGQWLNIYNGGVSASPYSAAYRTAIRAYYEWVNTEFVRPYADVILMLNLADEPLGGDYSAPAEAEFRARTGLSFAEASPAQVGAFQDGVIVDYAVWSAQQWAELAPGLRVTMSLCGAQARHSYTMPNLEALFRDPPANFVLTFDAYLHDYLPWEPMDEGQVGALITLAHTLGWYSQRYQRELWLWPAGNRWGLAGYGSSDPGGVSDALANGDLLALAVRATGGHLRGLAVWNYNVVDQGLYNDADFPPYDREAMFTAVSAALARWRLALAAPPGAPDTWLVLSEAARHTHLGTTRNAVLASPLRWANLAPLAQTGRRAVVVSALPEPVPLTHTVLALDPTPQHLPPATLSQLRAWAQAGGTVWATAEVLAALNVPATPTNTLPGDPFALSAAAWEAWLAAPPGFVVSHAGRAVFYTLRPAPLPGGWAWRTFDITGQPRPNLTGTLAPHELALSP